MQEAIDQAEPLVKLLWRRETEGQVFDTPERRAGLDMRLRAAIGLIKEHLAATPLRRCARRDAP
jgi:DNA primase